MEKHRGGEPVVLLENVSRIYRRGEKEVRAVLDASLEVRGGESLAVVGRSGSGKSTLLSLIGGIDVPTGGRVLFQGRDVSGLSDRARSRLRNRSVGFVFQSFHLVPELTVAENVETPLLYSDIREEEWKSRVARALQDVGLTHREDHRPGELSGGEGQRAAIARALVCDPDLVLADEPTGNLDSATEAAIADLLFALPKAGRALVLVTHDSALAKRADRVVEMRDGRIEGPRS